MKNNIKSIVAVSVLGLFAFLGCKEEPKEDTAMVEKIPGIILENMDTSVKPQDDFYNYVNGSWMKTNTIPEDETRWGGFGVLRKSTRADVLEIMNTSKELGKYEEGTDQKKALLIFETALDSAARDAAGTKPLQPLLEAIDGISSIEEMQTVYATVMGVSAPFAGIGASPDLNDSSTNVAWVFPGGTGLQRDYYLDQDDKSKKIREQYVAHVSRMLQYIDYSKEEADAAADKVLAMETQLVEPRLDKVAMRDARNYNNPTTLAELQEMCPAIDWNKMVGDLGITAEMEKLNVMQPKYMASLSEFLTSTSIEDIKILMDWSTVDNAAGYLSTEIEKANWEFYGQTLNGAKKMRPADERALGTVDGTVGEAIGKLYVDAKFPPEAKEKAEKMIANVIKAFQNRIQKLDWMTDSTKIKAVEKLDKFTVKIAYPDEWEDYSKMQVKEGNSYAENMLAVGQWQMEKNLSEIGEPVDKSEWGMPPQMVNAYFNPLNNEIVFPAAILQPPFYNYTADEAVNYGGIGAVIGHEISHAFDDSGARFDGDGNLKNWWTEKDLEEFTKRGNALAEQYSAIEVLDSVNINGKFTLGENIGDLGGVLGAYDGLQLFFEENGRPDDIDGFTAEQRFFMSWATVWRTLTREDALRTQIKTDPHSPGIYRATQPLKNIDAFYEAFGIKEGDGMWLAPEDRVRIW
ncbi:M13 family metallopeptidase [Psychroserpens sp.]|uniref:M13 family metallopeptidase n=1 Tax=Psychroserpens sp. TaxID=2020870 RepID=UPI001B0E1E7C|nr:M13 family metallopeptidase [Psychroserpens sp.]MBO6605502.1 M13 family metallopeptidase [Psychroserpens sp.]MBO6630657.1 M13 family metallopeptidase [Psychroserpens sp.]MBO6653689.1 M13 family metallopeptidase [Psychroserpens sp.]MBO6682010.1 M13 family metallopeptidase [Psychroserpens sp.]MBO6748876.1 M13 family metallopeptidase [Psychroserpens sp.]